MDSSVCAILVKIHGATGAVRIFGNPITNVVTGLTQRTGSLLLSESLERIAGCLEILHYDTSADALLEPIIYLSNASLDGRENSIFALIPRDESNSISMDGSGISKNGQIICKFGQLASYWWRNLRRSAILRSIND